MRSNRLAVVLTLPPSIKGPFTGPQALCLQLGEAISMVDSSVALFSYARGGLRALLAAPRIRTLGGLQLTEVGALRFLMSLGHYGAVHFAAGQLHAAGAALLRTVRSAPLLSYTAGGLIRMERRIHRDEETRAPYWREAAESVVVRSADLILCPSRRCADVIAAEWQIPEPRIAVVPYGVAPPATAPLPLADGTPPDPVILAVANMHRCKGLHFLIEACKQLSPSPFHLRIIAGGGSAVYRAALDRSIREAGQDFSARVEFLPAVSRALLMQHFASAAVFVQPSEFETFGLTALEALSCGTPVVVSDGAGVADVMSGCVAAQVVPYGDTPALARALRRHLTQPFPSPVSRDAAIERAASLSWAAAARATLARLHGLIRSPATAAAS